jgi:dTDP-4-dehydrorhamnose reductase
MNRGILVTGGSGLLGGELKPSLPGAQFPSSEELNICDPFAVREYFEKNQVSSVFHAAAFTSPPLIEQDPLRALETNIMGTCILLRECMKSGIRFVYVSTDYVFDGEDGNYKETDPVCPVNKYAWSKLGGECAAQLYSKALIIRTSFSENVFPYDKAFIDQWTSRQSVKKTAEQLIELFSSDLTGLVHLGGERQTVYDYAKSLDASKDLGEISIKEMSFEVPVDTSLDCGLYQNYVNEMKERV